MSTSLAGKCACSAITYTIEKAPDHVHSCYCCTCQAWSGGVLMSVAGGKDPEISNRENLNIWKSSEWAERASCKTCGSSIYYKVTAAGPYENQHYFCAGGLEDWKDLNLNKEMYIDRKPKGYCFQTGKDHTTETKAEIEAKFAS